jgi:hypothetical protein
MVTVLNTYEFNVKLTTFFSEILYYESVVNSRKTFLYQLQIYYSPENKFVIGHNADAHKLIVH